MKFDTFYLLLNTPSQVSKNIDRLGSTEEKRIFGGILDMIKVVDMPVKEDRYDLSSYLKPRHEKLLNLLKAMSEAKKAEDSAHSGMTLTSVGQSFADAGFTPKKIAAYPADEEQTVPKEVPTEVTPNKGETSKVNASGDLPLTPERVDDNRTVIENYLKAALLLRQSGFDPAAILKAEAAIRNRWEAIAALEASAAAFAALSN